MGIDAKALLIGVAAVLVGLAVAAAIGSYMPSLIGTKASVRV
jgi:hypothetical protein